MHISIIGAGLSGLASAALLAQAGHKVHVFEKNAHVGGRARVWKKSGFTFDMGPSWYLMPQVYEDFFARFDKSVADFYKLKRLDPGYRIFLQDQLIDIHADLKTNLKNFDQLEPQGAQKLQNYLKYAKQQYTLSQKSQAMNTSFDSFKDYVNANIILHGSRLEIRKDFYSILSRYFESEAARNVAAYAVIFLGADPRSMPGMFAMLSHIDYEQGVWYPHGGIGSVVTGLQKLCQQHGVEIHTNAVVQSIKVRQSQAQAVVVNNQDQRTDLVISATDYHHTETNLLPAEYQSYPQSYWQSKTLTPTAYVMHLGLKRRLKNLLHHNAFLHHGWQSHFDQIFNNPAWPGKPAYYVCCPSKTDPTVAPPGHENIFVTIPISTKLEDTSQSRAKYFDIFMDDFESRLGESIKDAIILKRIFTKHDFQADYNAYSGTALGPAPTLKQSGFFAPKHHSSKVDNLYYVGQYTHPGSGMPAVLHSAQIVANKVQSRYA